MNLKSVWAIVLIVGPLFINAQNIKRAIDTTAIKNWISVEYGTINHRGDYVFYIIQNEPRGENTLCIKSTNSSWEKKVINGKDAHFTENSNEIIFATNGDSVCILSLMTGKEEWLTTVNSEQLYGRGNHESLIYTLKNDKQTLIQKLFIKNLDSRAEKSFSSVTDFRLMNDDKTIFLKQDIKSGEKVSESLNMLDINDFKISTVWSGFDSSEDIRLDNIAFDTVRSQVAFKSSGKQESAIWYYRPGAEKSVKLIDRDLVLDSTMSIGNIASTGFSRDGLHLFFMIKGITKPEVPNNKTSVKVDIWSYKDSLLQSEQLYKLRNNPGIIEKNYLAVMDIKTKIVTRLGYDYEIVGDYEGRTSDIVFVTLRDVYQESTQQMKSAAGYFVSMRTGKRGPVDLGFADLSVLGKYLSGPDRAYHDYYTCDLATGKRTNVSKTFPAGVRYDEDRDKGSQKMWGMSLAGWMPGDSALIMYDKYDIWKVDPHGIKPAVNLTQNYGRSHHIILRFVKAQDAKSPVEKSAIYLLSAFDELTKVSGFFKWQIEGNKLPVRLSMGSYQYEMNPENGVQYITLKPSVLYLLRRESASDAPNYFITGDFKNFTALSQVSPQSAYNWMTSEVISWTTPGKAKLQGVLYKPENFNFQKKYPVIIYYYEKKSQDANQFHEPVLAHDNINIPWFVSRGYIVFTPDISYTIGRPLESALEAVVSGTQYIVKYPWIDKKHIGIHGHSWGSAQTNYIITHSHVYAAALSACGYSDFISGYGSLMKEGVSLHFFFNAGGQFRMNTTPWESVRKFEENSPVLRASDVTTPLLMMNNKEDAVTPFSQGVEFFTALRRLNKKVWMLQYDGEAHSLDKYENCLDYTIRMTQFFDHYLKGAPVPGWMLDGIPAKLKGINDGLSLDTTGREP